MGKVRDNPGQEGLTAYLVGANIYLPTFQVLQLIQ